MTRSEEEKQSYELGHNKQKNKTSRVRVYQLRTNGLYTAILGFFMSPGIEVNILFLMIHKNF